MVTASAAPAPAKATVAPLRASGTKKSPPVDVAERTYLTKSSYKRQKKADEPAAAPAPTAAPAPAPLVGVDGAAVRAPAEKKLPTVLSPVPAATSVPLLLNKPIYPCGILVEIVGTMMSCQGRLCEEHKICGNVLKEDVVVCLRKLQLMVEVEGKEETAIAAIRVTNGVDCCHVGFVPRHMVKHAARYNGVLAQVTHVLSDNAETCDSAE